MKKSFERPQNIVNVSTYNKTQFVKITKNLEKLKNNDLKNIFDSRKIIKSKRQLKNFTPVDWGSRIHRRHLCREVRPHLNECPA